jgi:hypothetical protein
MQVLGAVGMEIYCSRNEISDPELHSYIQHLWKITGSTDLPDWSGECTRLCDRLIARLAAEKKDPLVRLCNAAYEITASQMYTTYKPDLAAQDLRDVSDLSGVDLGSFAASDLFCRHHPGPRGWGETVPPNLVSGWRQFAQQVTAANSRRSDQLGDL